MQGRLLQFLLGATQCLMQGRFLQLFLRATHNASCKAGGLHSSSVPHNASCKAGRPLALPQCHTQCLMQGREAFSSSSVPHTMPHASLIPFVFLLFTIHITLSCKADSFHLYYLLYTFLYQARQTPLVYSIYHTNLFEEDNFF